MDVTIGSLTFDPVAVIDATRARLAQGSVRGLLIDEIEGGLQDAVGYCFVGAAASALGVSDHELFEQNDYDCTGGALEEDVQRAIEFVAGVPMEVMYNMHDGWGASGDEMALTWEDDDLADKRVAALLDERRAFFVAVAESVAAHKLNAQYDKLVSSLTEAATPELQRPKQLAE